MPVEELLVVVILEDEPLIAIELGDMLEGFGHVAVVLTHSLEEAIGIVGTEDIDLAVLDFNLGSDMDSTPVAELLIERNIPFVFVTGNEEQVRQSFAHVPVFGKPVSPKSLERVIRTVR
jgi:CheY-like chemotaxis protein